MPTGYTSDLYKHDVSFPDFVMHCAKAFDPFDAFALTRDDSEDDDNVDPFDYLIARIKKNKANADRIEAWSDDEADCEAQLAYEQAVREYKKELSSAATLRERYEAMIVRTKAWTPPTPKHQELKDLMIQQLKYSIRVDCSTEHLVVPRRLSGADYTKQQLAEARSWVSFYIKEHEEAVQQAKEAAEWVNALRQSLLA